MARRYGFDTIDGREVPQLVIDRDHVLVGVHQGTVHVEAGAFTLAGTLQGTLDIQRNVVALIAGTQQGSMSIETGALVTVTGAIQGSTTINRGSTLVIESTGKLAGSLANNGSVIVRGVFGGTRTGGGQFVVEQSGRVLQPTVRDGVSYYEW